MNSQMKEKSKQSSMWSIDSATSGGPASGGSKWSVSKVHAWLKYDLCSSGVPVFGVIEERQHSTLCILQMH